MLHPQTSQMSQSRVDKRHTTTNVTPTTNITTFKTPKALCTTNIKKPRKMFCARFVTAKMPFLHIHFGLFAKPEVIIMNNVSMRII